MFSLPRRTATLYRGGTSRGLIFAEQALGQYDQATRDSIICSTSSPDPDGRQIDGVGGGTSSLSKVAIISRSGSPYGKLVRQRSKPFPGLKWLDEADNVKPISDVIYRFGQVSIHDRSIDWGSTCGNMVAAAAHWAVGTRTADIRNVLGHLPPAAELQQGDGGTYFAKLRILAHDSGKVVKASVPVEVAVIGRERTHVWSLANKGDCQIAGVPGTAPGIILESPLVGSVLSTGNEKDTIEVDGEQIEVSIVDTGLPVVFVTAESLGIPLSSLLESPASIDSNKELMAKLERVRQKACTLTPALASRLSVPAPKLCVIHPRSKYTTTGGEKIPEEAMDLFVRVVSSGVSRIGGLASVCLLFSQAHRPSFFHSQQQLHRTVPATTLSALAASVAFPNSLVSQHISHTPCEATKKLIQQAGGAENSNLRAITIGQPAGCSSASVAITSGQPTSIVMLRTARKIMEGEIEIPDGLPVDIGLSKAYKEQYRNKASTTGSSATISEIFGNLRKQNGI